MMKDSVYFDDFPEMGQMKLAINILDDGFPILFCLKNGEKLYLTVYRAVYTHSIWTMSEIEEDTLIDMAEGRISVAEAFQSPGKDAWRIHAKRVDGQLVWEHEKLKAVDLEAVDLPDDDLFLDEDDREYIMDQLKSR